MSDSPHPDQHDTTPLRRALHAVNDELSIAILELELLLESGDLDATVEPAVREALNACRRAAASQRAVWAGIDHPATQT